MLSTGSFSGHFQSTFHDIEPIEFNMGKMHSKDLLQLVRVVLIIGVVKNWNQCKKT